MEPSLWFPYRPDDTPAGLRLFCLPPAGGGASGYRAWLGAFGRRVEVVPVQLPGREGRLGEEPVGSAAELVERLVEPVLAHAGAHFALFGHSMGALLAHDLAYALSERGRPPTHLIVSAHLPPHLVHQHRWELSAADMSDVDLRAYLEEQVGTPPAILDLPELMDLVLPILRADLGLCQSYRHTPRPPLPIPITALGGDNDPVVTGDLLARWSERTSGGFRLRILPGNHHYVYDDVAAITGAVSSALLEGIDHR
jgi:surfactin synthase thioesterase subunit